jgi:hypothetical protein
MARPKRTVIDVMRTKAWFGETLVASQETTAHGLKKLPLALNGVAPKFDYYRTGERVPSAENLARIETVFGSAPSVVFEKGPEGAPLWDVLCGDEDACREAVTNWLKTADDPRLKSDHVMSSWRSLTDDVVRAFILLGLEPPARPGEAPAFLTDIFPIPGPRPASQPREVAAFLRLERESAMAAKMRNHPGPYQKPDKAPGPDAVTGVFALRTLALMRSELLRETAYLIEVVRPLVPEVFREWNIGEDVAAFIRPD